MGWLFGLYLVFAGLERFLVEFVRAKDDRLIGAFTLAQLTSVIIILLGVALLTAWRRASNPPPGLYLETGRKPAASKT
jgi:phosphatidylglycerol:prolipoprotein diacylglycerol transferase